MKDDEIIGILLENAKERYFKEFSMKSKVSPNELFIEALKYYVGLK